MKYVTLTTDGKVNEVEIEVDTEIADYETLQQMMAELPIPIEWFECVYFKLGGHNYAMVIDDEGKLKDYPYNRNATLLYGGRNVDYIAGDAIILRDKMDGEMYFLTDDEVAMFMEAF